MYLSCGKVDFPALSSKSITTRNEKIQPTWKKGFLTSSWQWSSTDGGLFLSIWRQTLSSDRVGLCLSTTTSVWARHSWNKPSKNASRLSHLCRTGFFSLTHFLFKEKKKKTVLPSLVTRQESVVLCSPCWWLERFRADGLFSWSFGYSTQYTLLCVCMRENAKECVFMGWVKAVLLKINRRWRDFLTSLPSLQRTSNASHVWKVLFEQMFLRSVCA